MIILGLDVSTSTIGYAFTRNKKILDMGFVDLKKFKIPKEKALFFLTCICKNSYIDSIGKINIEDNLSGFAGGRTSQQTIIKLAKFNAILGYILDEEFGVPVQNINPMTARKNVFGKARVKGVKAKDFVREQIEKKFKTDKWCKTTKTGLWDKRNIDMYDGLVMSLYKN